jgi:cytidylate kinase
VIAEVGRRDRLVLVGRSAAAILARQAGTLHARLVAPRDFRIRIAIERRGIPKAEAPRLVDETDRNRRRYHKEFYNRDWDDPTHYDLVLNTERLGFEGAAQLIAARARALGW